MQCCLSILPFPPNKPGKTNSASHSIQVTNTIPVWSSSYSIPAKVEVGLHKALDELIDLDIIEPSTSKWSSPHIPIVKKDGDIRIVVEYRKLNAETVPEPFQMPTVDYIIASLGDAQFFSKLDLLKGFHQVPIVPESRPYTTFSCNSKYQYKMMSFGLRNAPATFQLLMQCVLRGLESFALPYIDDVVILSKSLSDHMSHIDHVLT